MTQVRKANHKINFFVPKASNVTLTIYNIMAKSKNYLMEMLRQDCKMLCGMARIILSFRLRMDFRLKSVFEVKIQKMIEEKYFKAK